MHPEARAGLTRMLHASGLTLDAPWRVLDLGGRDINGHVRDLLPAATWTGLDIVPGPGVDLVHDATGPWPEDFAQFDLVVCTEVFEHVQHWRALIDTAAQALEPGGPELLFLTCASTGRRPHGASGELHPPPGEWYANIPPGDLRAALHERFRDVHVAYQAHPGDAYAWARQVARPAVEPPLPTEPLIHSGVTDALDAAHPLAHTTVTCDGPGCQALLHCQINENMQTWVEAPKGHYCLHCFTALDEAHSVEGWGG